MADSQERNVFMNGVWMKQKPIQTQTAPESKAKYFQQHNALIRQKPIQIDNPLNKATYAQRIYDLNGLPINEDIYRHPTATEGAYNQRIDSPKSVNRLTTNRPIPMTANTSFSGLQELNKDPLKNVTYSGPNGKLDMMPLTIKNHDGTTTTVDTERPSWMSTDKEKERLLNEEKRANLRKQFQSDNPLSNATYSKRVYDANGTPANEEVYHQASTPFEEAYNQRTNEPRAASVEDLVNERRQKLRASGNETLVSSEQGSVKGQTIGYTPEESQKILEDYKAKLAQTFENFGPKNTRPNTEGTIHPSSSSSDVRNGIKDTVEEQPKKGFWGRVKDSFGSKENNNNSHSQKELDGLNDALDEIRPQNGHKTVNARSFEDVALARTNFSKKGMREGTTKLFEDFIEEAGLSNEIAEKLATLPKTRQNNLAKGYFINPESTKKMLETEGAIEAIAQEQSESISNLKQALKDNPDLRDFNDRKNAMVQEHKIAKQEAFQQRFAKKSTAVPKAGHSKLATGVGAAVAVGSLVLGLSSSRGQQSNAQLYGQQPLSY